MINFFRLGKMKTVLYIFLLEFARIRSTPARSTNNQNEYATTAQYRFRYFVRDNNEIEQLRTALPEDNARTLLSSANDSDSNKLRGFRQPPDVFPGITIAPTVGSYSNPLMKVIDTSTIVVNPTPTATIKSSMSGGIINPGVVTNPLSKFSSIQNQLVEESLPQFQVQKPLSYGTYRTGLTAPKKPTRIIVESKPFGSSSEEVQTSASYYEKHMVDDEKVGQQFNGLATTTVQNNGMPSGGLKSVEVELNYKDESVLEKNVDTTERLDNSSFDITNRLTEQKPLEKNSADSQTSNAYSVIIPVPTSSSLSGSSQITNNNLTENLSFYGGQKFSSFNTIAATPTTADARKPISSVLNRWWHPSENIVAQSSPAFIENLNRQLSPTTNQLPNYYYYYYYPPAGFPFLSQTNAIGRQQVTLPASSSSGPQQLRLPVTWPPFRKNMSNVTKQVNSSISTSIDGTMYPKSNHQQPITRPAAPFKMDEMGATMEQFIPVFMPPLPAFVPTYGVTPIPSAAASSSNNDNKKCDGIGEQRYNVYWNSAASFPYKSALLLMPTIH